MRPHWLYTKKENNMSWLTTITKAATGTAVASIAITASPVFGAVGTISTLGYGVAVTVGTCAAVADKLNEDTDEN